MINKKSSAYVATKAQAAQAMKQVQDNLQKVLNGISSVTEEQLKEIALTIHNTSNMYAPLDEGELRDSSYIAEERNSNNVTVEIGYKDPKSVFQHELYGTSYLNPTTPGTKPKFLQSAVTETEADIVRILADALKNVTKG